MAADRRHSRDMAAVSPPARRRQPRASSSSCRPTAGGPTPRIAAAVGLSEAAVRQRVQRLLDAGVMQIVAVTDPLQLGFARQAMIGVRADGDLARGRRQARRAARGRLRRRHRRLVRPARRGRLQRRRPPALAAQQLDPLGSRRSGLRDLRLPQARQADLHLGRQMTTDLQAAAKRHLWMHFTRMSTLRRPRGPDHRARRRRLRLGLARQALPRRAVRAVRRPGRARPSRDRRRRRQAGRSSSPTSRCGPTPTPPRSSSPSGSRRTRPGDINRVFFTTGGSEAVESAWKLARQYFKAIGEPMRYKVLSRDIAYHGTTMGALSINGVAAIKSVFEPLVPGRDPRPEHELLPRARSTATTSSGSASGPPTRSSGRSCGKAPRPSRRLPRAGAELRWLLHAAAGLLRSGSARSATSTASCWSATR